MSNSSDPIIRIIQIIRYISRGLKWGQIALKMAQNYDIPHFLSVHIII